MRYLTTLSGRPQAETFVAYLLTQNISTHVESSNAEQDQWEVWVRNEDSMAQANEELRRFLEAPSDPRYSKAIDAARDILKDQRQRNVVRAKNVQTTRTIVRRSMFTGSLPPLTLTLVIICVTLGVFLALNPDNRNSLTQIIGSQLSFVDPALYAKTQDPAASLKRFELWRILTPGLLHYAPLHLLMNMFALASLGRLVERLEGTVRFAWMVLFIAIVAHLLQGLLPMQWFGSPQFVGISGVVMGLMSYIAVKTHLRPDLGFNLPVQTYILTGLILILGFAESDAFRVTSTFKMANMAHLGGLIAGALLGYILNNPNLGGSRR